VVCCVAAAVRLPSYSVAPVTFITTSKNAMIDKTQPINVCSKADFELSSWSGNNLPWMSERSL
jgi:hypothetical protein